MVNKESAAYSALQLKSVQIKVAVSNWKQPTLMERGRLDVALCQLATAAGDNRAAWP
jgi:hypothetical protein